MNMHHRLPKALLLLTLLVPTYAYADSYARFGYFLLGIVVVQAIPGLWVMTWKVRRLTVYYFAVLLLSWPVAVTIAEAFEWPLALVLLLAPWVFLPTLMYLRTKQSQNLGTESEMTRPDQEGDARGG
jgi:hypothetical protein